MGKLKKLSHFDIKFNLKCQHCEKVFKYDSERKRHEESHSPRFSCKVCNKMFSFMSALRRHEKQHNRSGTVICDECNHSFRDESLLKRHKQYAHNETINCLKCDASFSSELALRCHMKIHNPESERRFRCRFEGCGKTFNFAHHLKHHEMTHTNTKLHFCRMCDKGFIQYHHYKEHLKKHKTWLMCPIHKCGHSFPTAYALKKHIATHKRDEEKVKRNTNSLADTNLLHEGPPSFAHQPEQINPVSPIQYLDFESKCSISDVNKLDTTVNVEADVNNIDESIGLSDTHNTFGVSNEEIEPIRNCHTYLGGCIVEEESNSSQKCLCDQICYPIEDTYDLVAIRKTNTCGSFNKDPDPIKIDSGKCKDCQCNNNVQSNNNNLNTEASKAFEEIVEYKSDGTIKIKEFMDMDINPLDGVKSSPTNNKDATVPSNSCKAVLGKCIVSGSGTISENCLCVKMTVDDQPMTDQEIDELTPCPKI